jgi:geranylgeranyl diphosphate synthase, type I
MPLSNEMLPGIEQELLKQVRRCLDQPGMEGLWSMMAYHMGWEGDGAGNEARGKRIRPLLVTLSAASCTENWQLSLPASAAVELIHNFSLIHDDIEDLSPMRRNRPTVWKLWGIPQAINTGDAMLSLAHLAIYDLQPKLPDAVVLQSARILQRTCLELTQGQFLDISYENRKDITLDAYWQMVAGKTAALLACCCELGALIGGGSAEAVSKYYQFGWNLGLAFQALDDILGIWGDVNQTGKSSISDLASGKKTLPVLFGLSQRGEFFSRWSDKPIEPQEIPIATQVLLSEGAMEFTQQHADRLTEQAQTALLLTRPNEKAGQELLQLANSLLARKN